MPMITVDNRTNEAPLCHVGVIVEPQSSHVKTHLGYPQRYPASMVNAAGVLYGALETFFVFLKLELPPKNQLVDMKEIYM